MFYHVIKCIITEKLTSLGKAVAEIDLHNRLKSNLLIKRTAIILYLFK